jgi:hypothetical protein
MRRLNVGLLHGLYQSKGVFAEKTQALRAALPAAIDLSYLDGPHIIVPPVLRERKGAPAQRRAARDVSISSSPASSSADAGGGQRSAPTALLDDYRGWWNPDDPARVEAETQETLRALGTQLRRDRVDGLIGFSQGGALAALLCTNKASELLDWSPAFVILCCAYESKLPFHQKLFSSGIDPRIPSLHIAGGNDRVIAPIKCWELSRIFHDAEFLETTAGHKFPTDDVALKSVAAFVEQAHLRQRISCP